MNEKLFTELRYHLRPQDQQVVQERGSTKNKPRQLVSTAGIIF